MKYIKKFEGRNPKIKPSEDEVMMAYKDKCDDLDDISHITFDQFFNGLYFDIFSNHSSKFYGAGIYAALGFEVNIKGQRYKFFPSEYGPNCPHGLENSIEWKKRNVFFFAEVNTGGASGGSCWDTGDDDGAQPYEGSSLNLNDFIFVYLKPILDNILYSHANEKSAQDLCQILYNDPSIIKEDSRSNCEYYGNYDNFSCHYITLGDLYKFLSENNSF